MKNQKKKKYCTKRAKKFFIEKSHFVSDNTKGIEKYFVSQQ